MSAQHPLSRYIGHFFNDYLVNQRGLSHNTLLAYRDALKLLFCFVAGEDKKPVEKLQVEDLDDQHIVAFLSHLETQRGVSARTRNARLAACRTFFRYLSREEPALLPQCQLIQTIPLKRTQHKSIDYLNEEEMKRLFEAVDTGTKTGLRDNALLLLMFNTGARAQEVVDLRIANLRFDKGGQVTLLGKGRKQRACPLWPETVTAIKQYLDEREGKAMGTNLLFLNAHGQPITRFGIRHIVKKYTALADDKNQTLVKKNIGPHSIRHSTAMHLIKAGNEINMVALWLGHADINTTHIYVEIDMEMKRKILEKATVPHMNTLPTPTEKQDVVLKWLDSLSKPKILCEVNTT